MSRAFVKMHGLGNDFVIIDGRSDGFLPDKPLCVAVGDRHRGIGYDQLIILGKPRTKPAEIFMRIYNPDGSEAGACINATRCVARLLFGETGKKSSVIETVSGLLPVHAEGNLVAVDVGPPRVEWKQIPLAREADTLHVPLKIGSVADPCCVNMGNPHAIFFVPDAEAVPVAEWGSKLEHDAIFPERCNIEFAQILAPDHIRMRVWERGTGITQACGSGACATLVAAVRRKLSARRATIVMDGGEVTVEWRADDHVILIGPAATVYRGELDDEFLAQAAS